MGHLRALASSDTVLSRRSRIGDRGAAQRLAARHLDRVTELAIIVTGDPDRAASLARQGFALALRGRRPLDDALVHAFARLAATTPDPDAARGRLLVLLVEVEHRPVDEAATLLGLGPDTASAMLPHARVLAGLPALARHCRGWGLVSRRGLSEAEHEAGAGHLALCRHCRDRLAELERTRAQLLGGTAGLATGLAAAQLLAAGGSAAVGAGAGAGGVLATKAIAGLVAAAAGTVLVAGSTAAVLQQPPHEAGYSPAPAASEPTPRSTGGAASPGPSAKPLLPGVNVPVQVPPVPIPAASLPALPLPTDLPTTLPALPVPLPALPTLPVPLPTLPVPLPTLPTTLPSPPALP